MTLLIEPDKVSSKVANLSFILGGLNPVAKIISPSENILVICRVLAIEPVKGKPCEKALEIAINLKNESVIARLVVVYFVMIINLVPIELIEIVSPRTLFKDIILRVESVKIKLPVTDL